MQMLSTKTYTHSIGISCCFRQWRASDSHCRFLHGYALEIELVFSAQELDHRNWVVNFGGLKKVKAEIEEMFDHKTLVAKDDPKLQMFKDLDDNGLIQIKLVDHIGCEAFAVEIFSLVSKIISNKEEFNNAQLEQVTVREHAGNSAIYRRRKYV